MVDGAVPFGFVSSEIAVVMVYFTYFQSAVERDVGRFLVFDNQFVTLDRRDGKLV